MGNACLVVDRVGGHIAEARGRLITNMNRWVGRVIAT